MFVQYFSGNAIPNTVIDGICMLVTMSAREYSKYFHGYDHFECLCRDLRPQLAVGICVNWQDEEGAKVLQISLTQRHFYCRTHSTISNAMFDQSSYDYHSTEMLVIPTFYVGL